MPKVPFVGRDDALRRLNTLAERIYGGDSARILITGAPGIGKTRLLQQWLAGLRADVAVLTMSGHAEEQELPFAGLHELLGPHPDYVDGMAEPRRSAVKAALALTETHSRTERFAVASGLHDLVTTWADRQPLVIAVDDAAWLDQSTIQALVFTVRRLAADPIEVVVASRPDGNLPFYDYPEMRLDGIDDDSARRLLEVTYPDLIPSVAARVLDTAQGVPLGLVDIPAHMSAVERSGAGPLDDPLLPGVTLERSYHRMLAGMSDRGREALLLACLGDMPTQRLAQALRRAGLDLADLEFAENAGLITIGESVTSVHPLVRSVVSHAAPVAQHDRAHRVLAEEYAGDPVRHAWHLYAVAHGTDDVIADALESAAKVAAAKAAFAEAGKAAEAAAGCSQAPEPRRRRLRYAVDTYARAGAGVALQRVLRVLVAEAESATDRARCRADEISMHDWTLDGKPDSTELVQLATQAAKHDATVAAELLIRAGAAMVSWRASEAAELRREAWRLNPDGPGTHQLSVLDDYIAVVAGVGLPGATIAANWADQLSTDEMRDLRFPFGVVSYVTALIGASSAALQMLDRLHGLLLETGAVEQRGLITGVRAFVKYLRGDWTGSEVDHTTAIDLCADTDLTRPLPFMRIGYAQLLAARGDERAREQVVLATANPCPPTLNFLAECATGLLELGLGRYDDAIEAQRRAGELERQSGLNEPAMSMRFGDLVEALWRSRRSDEIRPELDEFERRAVDADRKISLALAARAQALLVADDDIDSAFQRSLDLHISADVPFETARTALLWGERLRRVRRKGDARPRLREALDEFDRLGARPWAERARSELAACGERRGVAAGPAGELTPQELQVAVAVAGGATNPEVAATLCISRRTVEYHLSSVYRKLGVADRTALAKIL